MSQLSVTTSISQWTSQSANAAMIDSNKYLMLAGKMNDSNNMLAAAAIQLRPDPFGTWYKTYPGPFGTSFAGMTQIADGSYIAVGFTMTSAFSGSQYIWVVCLDVNGNVLWDQQYGSTGIQSVATGVTATPDGGFAVVGYTVNTSGQTATRIMRFTAAGDIVWDTTQSDVVCFSINLNTDGSFVLSGRNVSKSLNSNPVALIVDSNGNVKLNTAFTQFSVYVLLNSDAIQVPDGNFVLVAKWAIIKFDNTGKVLWSVSTPNGDFVSVVPYPDGNLLIGGAIIVNSSSCAYVVLTDDTGNNIIWDNTELETPSNISQVFIDPAGNAWGGGTGPLNNINYEMLLACFNPVKTLQPTAAKEKKK